MSSNKRVTIGPLWVLLNEKVGIASNKSIQMQHVGGCRVDVTTSTSKPLIHSRGNILTTGNFLTVKGPVWVKTSSPVVGRTASISAIEYAL